MNTQVNKIAAKFVGHQEVGQGSSGKVERIRLYNIVGPHERKGSTVTVRTLIAEGIPVDLSLNDLIQELTTIKELVGK